MSEIWKLKAREIRKFLWNLVRLWLSFFWRYTYSYVFEPIGPCSFKNSPAYKFKSFKGPDQVLKLSLDTFCLSEVSWFKIILEEYS